MIHLFVKVLIVLLLCVTSTDQASARIKYKKSRFLSPEYAAIVMDADTGKVLEEAEADALRHPASLTKMMTLYMIFKGIKSGQLSMNTMMKVSPHASNQAPSKLGLRPGDYVSVKTAILALITKSANDVAAVVAEHIGGSEPDFADKMTRQARSLGMTRTTFRNASGLPNSQQITSARDMAILSRTLYREFPQFFGHFKLQSFNYRGSNHHNHNHLLGKYGVDGIKTGYTFASGFNLAASAIRFNEENHPKRLIVVVLGGKTRFWRDAKVTELLETHFQRLGYSGQVQNRPSIDQARVTLTNLIEDTAQEQPRPAVLKKMAGPVRDESMNKLIHQVVSANIKKEESKPLKGGSPSQWFTPIPENVPSKKNTASNKRCWRIQVGAYGKQQDAQAAAKTALMLAKNGKPLTETISAKRKKLFAAQVTGLTYQDAEKACQLQRKKGGDCLVLDGKSSKSA